MTADQSMLGGEDKCVTDNLTCIYTYCIQVYVGRTLLFPRIFMQVFFNYSIILNIHEWFIQFQYFAPPSLACIVKFNNTTKTKFFAFKKTWKCLDNNVENWCEVFQETLEMDGVRFPVWKMFSFLWISMCKNQ